MSKNRFEQLIEYVINDDDARAKELFHQIVVEKSRNIYESLMSEEDHVKGLDRDNDGDHDMDDHALEKDEMDEGMDSDDAMGRMDQYDEALGGSQTKDLLQDIEADEEGTMMDDEEIELASDEEEIGTTDDLDSGDEGLEDRVVDLEEKLDDLIAEFESMMNDDEMSMDQDDTEDMSAEEVVDDEYETESMMQEAISLKQVHPKTTTSEESGTNTKSAVAANSGKTGMAANPVKMTGDVAQGRPAPGTKDLVGKVGNSPAQAGAQEPKAAPKPVTAQASGVNTRTPFPKG